MGTGELTYRTEVNDDPTERTGQAAGWVEKADFLEVLDLSWAWKDRLSLEGGERSMEHSGWERAYARMQEGCVGCD